jgi:hypothetical protein
VGGRKLDTTPYLRGLSRLFPIGNRPNEEIQVEKFTLGVAYLNPFAASIVYQSYLAVKNKGYKATKAKHYRFILHVDHVFMTQVKMGKRHQKLEAMVAGYYSLHVGYFAPYPDFAQRRNTKLILCAYTERQTSAY